MLATIQVIGILCGGLYGSSRSECLNYYISCVWPEGSIAQADNQPKLLKCATARLNEEALLREERWKKSSGK